MMGEMKKERARENVCKRIRCIGLKARLETRLPINHVLSPSMMTSSFEYGFISHSNM